VKPGDVVVEMDGMPITTSRALRLRVSQSAPGSSVKLVVERDGKKLPALTVKLGTLPEERADARGGGRGGLRDDDQQPASGYGLQVGPLTAEIARELQLPRGTQGVVVMNVQQGSVADEAGLARGDVIEELDKKVTKDANGLALALRAEARNGHLLKVRRGERLRYAALPAL
jgi:serine protease Do